MDNDTLNLILNGLTFLGGGGALVYYIRGMADRTRAKTEGELSKATIKTEAAKLQLSIEEDLREEAAKRFKEFRDEVHDLRNELGVARAELHKTAAQSGRRGDKLNMVLFILRLVMDELAAKEPTNKVLAQARSLLSRIEDEPHMEGNSSALNQAEDTAESAQATVREVRAEEAKNGGGK